MTFSRQALSHISLKNYKYVSLILSCSVSVKQQETYNFMKASCTLDASIKIYSYRVDDTWNSSYKVLENLSRNEGKKDLGTTGCSYTCEDLN